MSGERAEARARGTISPHGGSLERFGDEWNEYREMGPAYDTQFRGRTAPLSPEDWRGKRFPEAAVERRSAYDLQQKDEFDIAFSLSVIDRLECPELALERMMRKAGLQDVKVVWRHEMSWSAIGRKKGV